MRHWFWLRSRTIAIAALLAIGASFAGPGAGRASIIPSWEEEPQMEPDGNGGSGGTSGGRRSYGDPDDPQGSPRGKAPRAPIGIRVTGDSRLGGKSMSTSWLARAQVTIAGLRSFYWRF